MKLQIATIPQHNSYKLIEILLKDHELYCFALGMKSCLPVFVS